ncbi:phosphoribosylformylglycinamidine synthase subunit PurL [Conexibacter sp. S30A1]|uniref:phosphoribosylformylglycinamidine synthase subunit PurL n=1 Tax=Conexibacter sp. S30A1 TaxID=2937800 RepID=UPI00200DE3C5|nr:phosphoribosylformylglycinamidine synthase subunit PurL [Conexibacter sp. S30A1]
MTDTDTQPRHRELGLTDHEYALILDGLGRTPTDVELAMLSLMWSEHCAYKHSKKLLRRLPTEGAHVLVGPGENAGAVDAGDGLAVAFKVESHNHPSAVEPFQGAATGVGGILRDIFAVGARPIAVLDSLRFGEPASSQRSRYLLEHAVAGIGHYGNSIGVPTVGGEIYFEQSYEQNCLVNAMAVGLAPHDRLTSAAAAGPGNLVLLFGARTGRDGIGGASVLASAELSGGTGGDGGDHAKRPTVQIGDPFAEKKLMECSLELLDRELLASLQDLGAAGLTSAASEMASKGGVGLDIDVSRVPLREADMEPFEIMVSESQERMLCVVEPRLLDQVTAVCERWEVQAAVIGEVTASRHFRILRGSELVGEIPVELLVDDCPLYDLAPERPTTTLYGGGDQRVATDADPATQLKALLASANIASRLPVYEQYDPVVQSRTVRRPGEADAAVLALPVLSASSGAGGEPIPGIAVAIDGNGRRVAVDPRAGAAEVVYECAANLACVGAEPLGLTNCLNFGNPEKPHVAWQLVEAVEGLAQACRDLDVPVVGGNVSLYNESPEGPILPTPVIGMVGRLPDVRHAGRLGFANPGDRIALVGDFNPRRDGSEIAKLHGSAPAGALPGKDVVALRSAHQRVREGVRTRAFTSAHDIAEGGLLVALAECCIAGGVGAIVTLPDGLDPFGEDLGTAFIVSGPTEALAGLRVIGAVGGRELNVEGLLKLPVSELSAIHGDGLAALVS